MTDIHEAIGQWHDDSTNKQELHEYLGMTWEQYARWAELGELPDGSPFAEVTAKDPSYPPVAHVHLLPSPKGHNTMNQTDYEPQAIAKNGNVIITGWDAEYTVEAASAFIGDIAIAIKEARRQLAAIAEACAEGHLWGDGRNRSWGEKVTAYDCQRPGCTWSKTEPGWLPFEPKQHVVPFASKLLDCTGPGCEWCGNESWADTVNHALKSASWQLDPGLPLGKAASLEAKKHGLEWTIDATPEQVQAALDARVMER